MNTHPEALHGMIIAANRAKLDGEFPLFAKAANVVLRDMICPGSQTPHAAESVTYRVAGSARREETPSAGAGTLFPTICGHHWREVFARRRVNVLSALIREKLSAGGTLMGAKCEPGARPSRALRLPALCPAEVVHAPAESISLSEGSGVACRRNRAQTVYPTLNASPRSGSIFPMRAEVAQGQPAALVSCPVQ